MKRTLTLLTLLTLLATPAQTQEDRSSGNYMLPYRKSWLRMASNDVDVIKNEIRSASTKSGGITMHFIAVGMRAGEVVRISDLLLGGSGDAKACIPSEATNEQLVRVVVAEIEMSRRSCISISSS
jgi:hypothetical protein